MVANLAEPTKRTKKKGLVKIAEWNKGGNKLTEFDTEISALIYNENKKVTPTSEQSKDNQKNSVCFLRHLLTMAFYFSTIFNKKNPMQTLLDK